MVASMDRTTAESIHREIPRFGECKPGANVRCWTRHVMQLRGRAYLKKFAPPTAPAYDRLLYGRRLADDSS